MRISREFLAHQLKDVLAGFYDPVHLQCHSMRATLRLGPGSANSAQELREAILDALEALRPANNIPANRPEWLPYRVLVLRYIEGLAPCDVGEELGLGRTSFYRYHNAAIEALASILWDRHCASECSVAPNQASSQAQLAFEEIQRVANASQRQEIALAALLEGVLATIGPVARQRGLAIVPVLASDLPQARGDPALWRQLLVNVLLVGMDYAARPQLELRARREGDEIVFSLSGLRDTIAEPTRLHDGTLGLFVCEKLSTTGGGRLWTEHNEAYNVTLCWALPLAPKWRVLVIDDNDEAARLYRSYLQGEDMAVQHVLPDEQTLQEIVSSPPDLILLDLLMPQYDGWEVLQRIKLDEHTQSIPVVICSVLSQPELALSLGAVAVLQKPINQRVLVETIRQHILRADSAD